MTETLGPIKAVLFDKDGTLFSFNETWSVFCVRLLDELVGDDRPLRRKLAEACGFDEENNAFLAGSLVVAGAADDLCKTWSDLLDGVSAQEVDLKCQEILKDLPLAPVGDLSGILKSLQFQGLRLGVATNDLEAGAVIQLKQSATSEYFDFVCGCDSGFGSKPGSGMVDAFCEKFALQPGDIAFVGDSVHDMECGVNAGVGLKVGVLTGPATREELNGHADVVLGSIAELPDYLSAR
ncbi:HAD family hydrolase [Kiloniella sp. b19]|uniref:HAD family hydrolase n=1 Tax=Kiloniella sp. GXU_MW_B19 TaxID=3141326 RepID=UPI0031DAA23F